MKEKVDSMQKKYDVSVIIEQSLHERILEPTNHSVRIQVPNGACTYIRTSSVYKQFLSL